MSEQEASEVINKITIYHPYGKVGHLPWPGVNNWTEFGANPSTRELLMHAHDIKTFTEGTNPSSSDIISIRENIAHAERLVFMGFAFHKLNMELLQPSQINDRDTSTINCFATTLGISDSDKNVIRQQIYKLYGNVVNESMANVECKNLFTEFRRSLAF